MLISMTPNDEVKTIHASLNDGSLRKWEFEPYTEQGKIELTDQDYATIQSIKGNTVKFNQLIQNGNFADTSGWLYNSNDASFSVNNNIGSLVLNADVNTFIRQQINFIANHKYAIFLNVSVADTTKNIYLTLRAEWNVLNRIQINPTSNLTKQGFLVQPTSIGDYIVLETYSGSNGNTLNVSNFMCLDLTAMGIDNLTTVEQVETWLSNKLGLLPYYDYTLGDLISFNGTGLKTTGKNLYNLEDVYGVNAQLTVENNKITIVGTVRPTARFIFPSFIASGKLGKTFTLSWNLESLTLTSINIFCGFIIRKANNTYRYVSNGNKTYGRKTVSVTLADGETIERIDFNANDSATDYGTQTMVVSDVQLEIGSTATEYEPYISNTLSLPISTYFPTGMKKAETVYDELASSKATTRLNEVVFNGSESWGQGNPSQRFYLEGVITDFKDGSVGLATNGWEVVTNSTEIIYGNNKIWFQIVGSTYRINAYANTLGLANVQEFKTYLASNPLTIYYELATPTEQDVSLDLTYPVYQDGTEQILPINGSTPTTSPMVATIEYPDRTEDVDFLYKQTSFESAIPQFSLVCKNQELPMTLENDKLICECDSSITNESGFFDCKVKMQDLDSVAYSQKIQLHVERGIND